MPGRDTETPLTNKILYELKSPTNTFNVPYFIHFTDLSPPINQSSLTEGTNSPQWEKKLDFPY